MFCLSFIYALPQFVQMNYLIPLEQTFQCNSFKTTQNAS